MSRVVVAGAAVAGTMLALDAVWLSTMAGPLYRTHLPGVMLENGFRLGPAVAFYLLYLAGVVYFAVMPALEQGRVVRAAINGALLGLVAYGTYDLTNHATMKVWSPLVTAADMVWGTLLTATAASVGAWVGLRRAA